MCPAPKRGKQVAKRKKRTTERTCLNMFTISGGNDEGVTPVPIPNTEVKPFSADGTWLVTARESRSPPDSIFLSSSMAEHSAVNRRVVGSSPTWGAQKPAKFQHFAGFCFICRQVKSEKKNPV